MKRNILLVFILIVSSLLLAMPFGNLIVSRLFSSQGGFATFSFPSDLGDFLNGLPFLYFFLSTLLFGLFGKGKKWVWSIISILPILYGLFYIESGIEIWFWSVIFFVAGIILSIILKKLFKQNSARN
jgi:hypothetical protein